MFLVMRQVDCTLLLFKIEREYWSVLKTFLQYLNVVKEDELFSSKYK